MTSQPRQTSVLLRDNGLLLACLGVFAIFFAGMIISRTASYSQEQFALDVVPGAVIAGARADGSALAGPDSAVR